MNALTRGWTAFWFAPKDALTLGIARLIYFGLLFFNYSDEHWSAWAGVSKAFWDPIWVFEKFHIPLLGGQTLFAMEVVWKTALACACVGLLTRLSTATAFALGFYLLGLRHNFGKASHDDASTILILLILALSRCGDALSIDALFGGRRLRNQAAERLPLESGEYRWPIRAVWLVLAMVFFNSAVAKLRKSGLEWALSENLSVLMVRLNYFNKPVTDWGLRLANIPWFGHGMGLSAIIVELCFPLVLFSRIARRILVPAAFLMQLGNKFLLGVDFTVFMFAYVFFIDWGWLLARLGLIEKTATTSGASEDDAARDVSMHAQAVEESIFDRRRQVQRVPPPPAG